MNVNEQWGWGRGRGEANSLTVTTVLDGRQADRAGIKAGWTITSLNGVRVGSEAEFKGLVADVKRRVGPNAQQPAWAEVGFDTGGGNGGLV